MQNSIFSRFFIFFLIFLIDNGFPTSFTDQQLDTSINFKLNGAKLSSSGRNTIGSKKYKN